MPDVDPEVLAFAKNSAAIAAVMPEIDTIVEKMEAAVVNKTLALVWNGTLTPEAAVAAWNELAATRRLKMRLDSVVKAGHTAREEIAPNMELE